MNIFETLEKYEARSMHGQLPVVWKKAKGSFVWDINGKKYIDFTSGICVANAGHNNPKIVEAIRKSTLYHTYSFPTEIRAKYLKELCEFTGFDKAFLLSSGTEATECAVKIMRMASKKKVIVSFKGAMHGKTMLAEQLKGDFTWADKGYTVWHMPFPADSHKFIPPFKLELAGFMIESYRGWDAAFYPKQYIQDLCNWAKENKVLVCFDEIQGGFGRTGKMFAYEHYDIPRPDLVCIGKGMTSSVPMSGVLGSKDLLDLPDDLSSTHSANPLCCAVGLANLKEIKRILPTIKVKEKILFDFLYKRFFNHCYPYNSKGLLAALTTPTAKIATDICKKAMENGLLLIKTDKPSVKIAPPLTITEYILLEGLEILFYSASEVVNG